MALQSQHVFFFHSPVCAGASVVVISASCQDRRKALKLIQDMRKIHIASMQNKINIPEGVGYLRRQRAGCSRYVGI